MATVELTEANLSETIRDNDIVLVDFWAEWCGPCKQFGPVFEAASDKHEDLVFGKIDTDAQQTLAQAAGVTSIPTLMAFREQVLVFAQPGALNGTQLDEIVTAVKGLDMDHVRAEIAKAEQEQQDLAAQEASAEGADGDASPVPGQQA